MQVQPTTANVVGQYFTPAIERAYAYIDLLALHFCFGLVHRFGLFDGQPVFTFDDVVRKTAAVRDAEYLLRTALDILREEGYVLAEGEAWRVSGPCPPDETAKLQDEARESCPGAISLFEWMERCHAHAGSFITGEESGLDVFFPSGDLRVWEQVHRESGVISVYNELVAMLLESLLPAEGARVLEVGGGIGGVVKQALPMLRERNVKEYYFTDLGKYFVKRMQGMYGGEEFLRFAVADMDRPLAEQGIEPGFDLIVGVSVVHAAKKLEFTLLEFRSALREGGHLLLGEASPPLRGRRWRLDMVVAFLTGWWDVTLNPPLRPRPGLLFPSEWLELFRVCGYQSAMALPGEVWFRGPCRGGLLLARK
jgi:SAM-dependent methyltransferase